MTPLSVPPDDADDGLIRDWESGDDRELQSALLNDLFMEAGFDVLGDQPALAAVEAALRTFAFLLRDADALQRALARGEAIRRLEGLGVRAPAKCVDAILQPLAERQNDAGGGQEIELADPESWPDQVNGARLLDELVALFDRHILLPAGGAVLCAVWVLFTYCLAAVNCAPYLAATSPLPECGKSTLMALICALARRALFASNITPAATFRVIEKCEPTLICDELDTYLENNDELRGVLNSGHTRATAFVIRTAGDNHEVRRFSTWSPKALAKIGSLPPTLRSRSVELPMIRQKATEQKELLPVQDDVVRAYGPLRSRAARWAADNLTRVRGADPTMPSGLANRLGDNWRPLFAVADAAGGDWPTLIREAARQLTTAEPEKEMLRVRLLHDIREVFSVDRMHTESLLAALAALQESPWGTYKKDKDPIDSNQLAGLLRSFTIRPAKTAFVIDGQQARGYERSAFQEAWERYLSHPDGLDAKVTCQPRQLEYDTTTYDVSGARQVDGFQIGLNSFTDNAVDGVDGSETALARQEGWVGVKTPTSERLGAFEPFTEQELEEVRQAARAAREAAR